MANEHVFTREQSRMIDSVAQQNYAIPGLLLMENAGLRCADVVYELLQQFERPWSVAIVTGKGNNGGDGFVIARHLHNRGVVARIYGVVLNEDAYSKRVDESLWAELGREKRRKKSQKFGIDTPPPSPDFNDSLVNLRIARRMGILMIELGTDMPVESLATHLEDTDIIVDALLGTGSSGAPRQPYDRIISIINAANKLVVAVDLPSGLDANTGETAGECIRAHTTVSFAARKKGFEVGNGPQVCGNVRVADISIPISLIESVSKGKTE